MVHTRGMHDGKVHDGKEHDGKVHDGKMHDGKMHDGRLWYAYIKCVVRTISIIYIYHAVFGESDAIIMGLPGMLQCQFLQT